MDTPIGDELSLRNRLRYSWPREFAPDAEAKLYYCTYCPRVLHLFPHEFRLCQSRHCVERAIKDRDDRIFEIQLSIPRTLTELRNEKAEILRKISDLESREPNCFQLIQYRGVLCSLEKNLGFYAKNEKIDMILILEEQIKELSKRIVRPSFSDAFRRELWERDQRTCYLCKLIVPNWDGSTMHIDHVRPRSLGGSDESHNLRVAHAVCNLRKGDQMLSERRLKAVFAELRKSEQEDSRKFLF